MPSAKGVFDVSAAVFDLLYAEKDTMSEVHWIQKALSLDEASGHSSLLELGAGTGRHARAFGDLGFSVTATEPSAEMLRQATKHDGVEFLLGDGRSLRLGRKFDVVLALFHVMSYQTSLTDVSNFFETASRHLNSGGVFGFDVWYSPAVLFLRPEERSLTKENDAIRVTRTAVPLEDVQHSRVDVHYTYTVEDIGAGTARTFQEVHAMRHFTITEIQLFSEPHGFRIVDVREYMSERTPGRETWGVWFTLQKS